jgi:hypothetical protein
MIVILPKYSQLLYPLYLNNNSGDQDRPPNAGWVAANEFWLDL